jgi:predicted transposase/invertase (TIGR01784 family)
MAKPWDEPMKKLVDANPQHFVDWLVPGGRFLDFVPTELLKTKEQEEPLRADRYLAVELNGQGAIVHLEFQSGPDARMAERLLEYNFRMTQNDPLHRTVYSFVIYLRPVSNAPQSPLVRIFPTGQEIMWFHYGSIELAALEGQALLDLGFAGLLPLLPLTKGGTAHEMVLTMFNKLEQTARTELMALGAIFASLAYGQDNRAEQTWLERMLQDMYDIVQQTPLYQSWTRKAHEEGWEEGRQEGHLEGKLEGLRQTLVNIVRVRFPRLVSLAEAQATTIADPDLLEGLIIKVSAAHTAKEARRYLREEEGANQEERA